MLGKYRTVDLSPSLVRKERGQWTLSPTADTPQLQISFKDISAALGCSKPSKNAKLGTAPLSVQCSHCSRLWCLWWEGHKYCSSGHMFPWACSMEPDRSKTQSPLVFTETMISISSPLGYPPHRVPPPLSSPAQGQ